MKLHARARTRIFFISISFFLLSPLRRHRERNYSQLRGYVYTLPSFLPIINLHKYIPPDLFDLSLAASRRPSINLFIFYNYYFHTNVRVEKYEYFQIITLDLESLFSRLAIFNLNKHDRSYYYVSSSGSITKFNERRRRVSD